MHICAYTHKDRTEVKNLRTDYAEALKQGTVAVAQENERAIVDMETIQYTNEQLIGTLAFASGLIDRNYPISAKELAGEFTWDKLKGDSIYLDAASL